MPDLGQAFRGMEGTDSRALGVGRWRGKQPREAGACPPHPYHLGGSGRPGWIWLSTKTPWCLGHGAGIPLLCGVPETVTVHGSTAGGDRPHPSLRPACHPGGLLGAVAGSAWHRHLERLAQPPAVPEPQHRSLDLVADVQVALTALSPAEHPGTGSRTTCRIWPGRGMGRCWGATPRGEAELKIKPSCSGATLPSPDYSQLKFQLLQHPAIPRAGEGAKWLAGTEGTWGTWGAGGTWGMDRGEGGKERTEGRDGRGMEDRDAKGTEGMDAKDKWEGSTGDGGDVPKEDRGRGDGGDRCGGHGYKGDRGMQG